MPNRKITASPVKVSVLMLTYNHEGYIAEALDSALMQEAPFPYEIVVGEDCSTDGTRDIVRAYQQRFPERIRLLLPEKNLGMMRNLMATYKACEGAYIAILEGDDYWTSTDKLRRQVEFLDFHPDFAMVFHNAVIASELNPDDDGRLLCHAKQKPVSLLEDLLYENFIPALTVMFRNRLFGAFPPGFGALGYGDWSLHILNAQHGKIGYLPDVMATYRVHAGGVASRARYDFDSHLGNIEKMIDIYRFFDKHLQYTYHSLISSRIKYCRIMEIDACRSNNKYMKYIIYVLRHKFSM